MIKEKKSLKNETSSRRKFFKTAAKAGAVAAATVAMPKYCFCWFSCKSI